MTNTCTFTSDEIKHALEIVMTNDISARSDGRPITKRYIAGFTTRIIRTIEKERNKKITK